jgi:hypothetical protein
LSDRFEEVVLLERDELPSAAAPRKGTPHAVHPHGLLARGFDILEKWSPGFTAALVARGGLLVGKRLQCQNPCATSAR